MFFFITSPYPKLLDGSKNDKGKLPVLEKDQAKFFPQLVGYLKA